MGQILRDEVLKFNWSWLLLPYHSPVDFDAYYEGRTSKIKMSRRNFCIEWTVNGQKKKYHKYISIKLFCFAKHAQFRLPPIIIFCNN